MTGNKLSSDSKLRIDTMVKTNNGFEIADVDLKLRGPGNVMGTQQSGVLNLKIANIIHDNDLLILARETAQNILNNDKNLESELNQCIKHTLSEMGTFKNIWNYIS
jgi:ATP-dependent DNA helicase RecG